MNNAITTIIGTAGRDPELRFSASGTSTAKFSVAVSYRRPARGGGGGGGSGDWEETTSWITVICFGSLADNVAESIQKGSRVMAQGRLEVRDYETQDGTKGRAVELIADEVGPSLRWATARVEKAERREGGSNQGGSNSATNTASSGSGAPAPDRQTADAPSGGGYSYDEEPF